MSNSLSVVFLEGRIAREIDVLEGESVLLRRFRGAEEQGVVVALPRCCKSRKVEFGGV